MTSESPHSRLRAHVKIGRSILWVSPTQNGCGCHKSVNRGTIALPVPDSWDAFEKKAGSEQVFVFALSLALQLHTLHFVFLVGRTVRVWAKTMHFAVKTGNNHRKCTFGILFFYYYFCNGVTWVTLTPWQNSIAFCWAGICPGLTRQGSNNCVQVRVTCTPMYLYMSFKGQRY